jgi:hypothetical protein
MRWTLIKSIKQEHKSKSTIPINSSIGLMLATNVKKHKKRIIRYSLHFRPTKPKTFCLQSSSPQLNFWSTPILFSSTKTTSSAKSIHQVYQLICLLWPHPSPKQIDTGLEPTLDEIAKEYDLCDSPTTGITTQSTKSPKNHMAGESAQENINHHHPHECTLRSLPTSSTSPVPQALPRTPSPFPSIQAAKRIAKPHATWTRNLRPLATQDRRIRRPRKP